MRFLKRGKQQTEVRIGLSSSTISNIERLNAGEFKGNGTPVWDLMGCFSNNTDDNIHYFHSILNYRPLYEGNAVEGIDIVPTKILEKGKCKK